MHKEEIRPIEGYVKIFLKLSENHELDEYWTRIILKVKEYIHKLFRTNLVANFGLREGLYAQANDLLARIQKYNRTESPTRIKRGLFNFIGEIGSTLFGIPSPSDIEGLKEANRKLGSAVQGVVRTQRGIITKVNQIGRQQQILKDTVNKVIRTQNAQARELEKIYAEVSGWVSIFQSAMRIQQIIHALENHVTEYELAVQKAEEARYACEAQIVNEQVIPKDVVYQILTTGENRHDIAPEQYYAYIKVRKITVINGELFCILEGPQFQANMQMEITIKTLPVCEQGRCIQIHQPPPFVLDYETENLYFPDECHGPTPKACRPGVIFDKDHQPCLHGLINHDAQQQKMCPLTLYVTPPPLGEVTAGQLNRFLVTTKAKLYHYRCPTERPITGKLEAGHYLIDIEPRCVLDAGSWIIRGLPTTILRYNITVPPPEEIPLSWLEFPNITLPELNLPAGAKQIEFPDYEALKAPPESNILDQIDEIQKNIGVKAVPWWVWVLVSVISLLGLAALACYLKTCCPEAFTSFQTPSMKVQRPSVKYHASTEEIYIEADPQTDQKTTGSQTEVST